MISLICHFSRFAKKCAYCKFLCSSCNKQGFQQFMNKSQKIRHQCIFNVITTIILAFIERYSFQTNWYIQACIYMIEYNVKKIFGSYLDIKSLIPTWLFLSYVQFIASEIKSLSNNNIQNCYRLRAASWTKIQFATRNKRRTNNDFLKPRILQF